MYLQTDEQTLDDLEIFSKKNAGGIFDLYNAVSTRGGEEQLRQLFKSPLSDKEAISRRSAIIDHFGRSKTRFPYEAANFDMAEKYLLHSHENARSSGRNETPLNEKEIQNGVTAIIHILRTTLSFMESLAQNISPAYENEREEVMALLSDPAFEPVLNEKLHRKLAYSALTAYDILFRVQELDRLTTLLKHIYNLDVYCSVASIALKRNLVFPVALEKGVSELVLEEVYHPELKNPVGNALSINSDSNIIFLTGANMAGKSTFLRTISTALYLAHMGFPVSAKSMVFSVMDGIYTTINLPDKLGIGASHFYMEVLRVRKVAMDLGQGKSLFVIFDEMFRGTNVKDAHEATVAVTTAFARKKSSIFVISSHIVEAAEQLKQLPNVSFFYLPTKMDGQNPVYTYQLAKGVTDDRHGMIIIRNEGILDILKNGRKKLNQHIEIS